MKSAWWVLLLLSGCSDARDRGAHSASESGSAFWASAPMPNSPGLGLPNEQRYEVTTLGEREAVLDHVTELVWQRRVADESYDFEGATEYCRSLEPGEPALWRLPARVELVSLLRLTRAEPAIDDVAFPGTPGDWFWTASLSATEPTFAWYTYFYFGYPDWDDRATGMRVRCVHGPADTPARASRYARGEAVARDERTHLVWQRGTAPGALTFAEAEAYCAALVLDGSEDFRVPSMQELQTLLDEGARSPAIDAETFPDTAAEPFWTSSGWAGSEELAWYVSFEYGAALYDSKASAYHVRCVR